MLRLLSIPVALAVLAAATFPTVPTQDERPADEQRAEETDAQRKERKVRELIDVTGVRKASEDSMEQVVDLFRDMPGLPEGFLDAFLEALDVEDLIDLVVPIYLEHLDEETIDGTIAFAKTEAGRKLYAAQPAILTESMEVGAKFGQDLAMRVMLDLDK